MANDQQYTNESSFVLFKNDKGDNPKRPDYRGKLYLGGEEYKLSAWIREQKDGSGKKYMRGQIEKAQPIPAPVHTGPSGPIDDKSDDIAF